MPGIVTCRTCGAVVLPLESGGACPQCRTPVGEGGDETRLAVEPGVQAGAGSGSASGSGSRPSSSSAGWLSSSGAIDHGRFQPGTLLGGRYRIVERLGRGGMGEVYRADDLKLGQQVALKFLSADVDADPARLTQLHNEVRTARLVSHPNVCRVYDIGDMDGQTFISMEYVDGEDLSSLLRRIGRFPQDRALAIARQICAGLSAAHERGVIHRDLKPANVMLDAAGRARITDFGLAGVSGESLRAGTPAYMAPEQLAGGEVTARSDIYALGLVLYEIFTGRRALEAKNLAELIRKREQEGVVPPSAIVPDLDAAIERAILGCLDGDAGRRPASALAVSVLLPGGDPLAAALAAGETPSPEMVAAAGRHEAIPLVASLAGAAGIVLALVALTALYQRVMLINRLPPPKPPAALLDRAQEALATLGYHRGFDSAHGVGFSHDYVRYLYERSDGANRWDGLSADRPPTFLLWHRTSPRLLEPAALQARVAYGDPPLSVGGMTLLVVDGQGRLAEFHAVPPPIEQEGVRPSADWKALFTAAALDMDAFTRVEPALVPLVFADERAAWEAPSADASGGTLRVEAAAHAGRPVFFAITGPWTHSARAPLPPSSRARLVISGIAALVIPALMLAAALLARRQVKLGRGDRRGAFRAASVVFVASVVSWMLAASFVGSLAEDVPRLFSAMAVALFRAAVLWLAYLAFEPYVRRFAPDSLIGWSSAIAGHWRDPRVGTDVLIGVCAGLAMTLLYGVHNVLPVLAGRPEPVPLTPTVWPLLGPRLVLSAIIGQMGSGFTEAMLATVGVVALLMLLKRAWLAGLAAAVIFTPVVLDGMFPDGTPLLDLAIGFGIITVLIVVILRFGLLASVAALMTHFVLLRAPLTTQLGDWRGAAALWYLGVIAVAGLGAVYVARAGTVAPRGARS